MKLLELLGRLGAFGTSAYDTTCFTGCCESLIAVAGRSRVVVMFQVVHT